MSIKINDKYLFSIPLDKLEKIILKEKEDIRKYFKELQRRRKLIEKYKKIQKVIRKIKQGKVIQKKPTLTPKKQYQKTFEDYFEEYKKNKIIPPDTPYFLLHPLKHAIKEHEQGIEMEKSALNGFVKKYTISGPKVGFGYSSSSITLFDYLRDIASKTKEFLRNHRNIKVRFILVCNMQKQEGDIKIEDKVYFHSNTHINLNSTDVKKLLNKIFREIIENVSTYTKNGSGWYFKEVIRLEIHTIEYMPIKGSSYIPLPEWIMRKKAIVSLRNEDDKCFIWSILRYLHPREKNDCRLKDLKPYEFSLNTKGITFPMKVKDIDKFEKLNPDLPGINVFSITGNTIYPLREISKDRNSNTTIDLFLYEEDGKFHYSLIKNLSRLIRSQITTRTNEPIHICKRCFSHFTKKELLDKHIQYCNNNATAIVRMPKPKTILLFKNYQKQLPIPFVVYADFECFTKPINTCSPNPENSYNYSYQKHEPSGFCIYVKGIVDKWFKPITYTKTSEDEDVSKIFVEKIIELTKTIYNDFYCKPQPLRLTSWEYERFKKEINCHICMGELKHDKVRDHCHFTGRYRGAAHNLCNLRCKKPLVLPVIFHNLQGYDGHLFIKQLSKYCSLPGEITCIPSTEEKYISFSKSIKVSEYFSRRIDKIISINFEIRFIDSFKFLQTSLANLVSNLTKEDFHNTKYVMKDIDLLTRKGVYPYDYVTGLEKLLETQLPPKEAFYSRLNNEDISDEDYQHALNVWNTFGCSNIRDYHNLYLKTDVLLLADVFENFRKICLKYYHLDPAHYYTSPGLAWDACLKETGQQLELLHDYDMLMMIEKGIRGGMTHISKRYAEANNKYMKSYNPEKESSFIQYLDANNLYGWAMTQNLPTHGFKWMSDLTVEGVISILEKVNHSMSNIGKKGYIFEVDLEYPTKLWEKHNDYPLAPEKINVDGVEKLISHFKPRKNYVVHYRILRQYLELGMKITAVHRGISFYQSSWMEPYIRKNTELRQQAIHKSDKDFFKLMNNSVFGKTIENIRKRQNIFLVDNRKRAKRLANRPDFERATIFDKNLIAIHMKKTEIYFNKPVYVGQAILDLSKLLMFDFHYNYIKRKYKDKAELVFTDTDSLLYHILTDDFYKDISCDLVDRFDTSDYPSIHPSGIPTGVNKKVIGLFKDEVAGKQITHFVGLRPKLYSFKVEDGNSTKKCKGVKKNVVKKEITFEDYVKCLFSGEKQMRSMKIIGSENHDIYSKEVNKIALSNQDDKRIILENKINTLALR